jgi:hypothetical protein
LIFRQNRPWNQKDDANAPSFHPRMGSNITV